MSLFGRKPAPAGFKDPNLRLAVLEAAWDAKLLPPFDKDAFYRDTLGETWDANRDGDRIDERTRAALLAIPLPSEVLTGVVAIDWGGGKEAQHLVFHFWDGEDEAFDVTDLTGIGACGNVQALSLGAATLGDLTPLLELKALRRLKIGGRYRDDDRNRKVLQELKSRGVEFGTRGEIAARISAGEDAGARKRAVDTAMQAFQEKRFADVVRELEPFAAQLEGSDLKKLAFARKQAGMQG